MFTTYYTSQQSRTIVFTKFTAGQNDMSSLNKTIFIPLETILAFAHLFFGLPNPGYVTEKGREFIIAFVENRILVDYPIIKLYATSVSEIPINVTFSVPLMTDEFADETLELQPGQVAVKEYPYELHMLDDGADDKGKTSAIVVIL